jgi:hypothetical protein
MMSTVVGLIAGDEHVTLVGEALKAAGFSEDKISILCRPAEVWQRLEGRKKLRVVYRNALIGMLLGLVVGVLYGATAGILNCRLMNCPVTTSLILLALISLYWLAGGGFLGALIGLDRLERDLYSYVEGVRRGAALFVVESPEERAPEVAGIMAQEEGAVLHVLNAA